MGVDIVDNNLSVMLFVFLFQIHHFFHPDRVAAEIKKEIARLRAEGISQAAFERAKKAVYGRNIVSLNSAENIANTMISLHFAGNELFGYLEEVAALTRGDVEARLREQMDPERSVLSVVSPIS